MVSSRSFLRRLDLAVIALWPAGKMDTIGGGLGSEDKVEASILYPQRADNAQFNCRNSFSDSGSGNCGNQVGFTAVQIGRNGDARTTKRAVQTLESHLLRIRTLFRTLWHRTAGAEPILIVSASSGCPLNDNPSPTSGTCHARAQNPIGHSTIIGRPRAGGSIGAGRPF